MTITIELKCPHRHSPNIVRNRKKSNHTQNYLYKACGKQYISYHKRTYWGTLSYIAAMIKIMLVRGIDVRDISVILNVSIGKVLKTLKSKKVI